MSKYTPEEERNMDLVNAIFEGPADFDRVTAFSDDAVWWNGLPRIPGAEGVTEHRGIEAIRGILYGAGQAHDGKETLMTFPQTGSPTSWYWRTGITW